MNTVYYPFYRGKQFELLAIRDGLEFVDGSSFTPIVEPVRSSFRSLGRMIDAVLGHDGRVIVVSNPTVGEFADDNSALIEMLSEEYGGESRVLTGVLVHESWDSSRLLSSCSGGSGGARAILHRHSLDRDVVEALNSSDVDVAHHVFFDGEVSRLYRRHFEGSKRVLIRDGFNALKNREYLNHEQELFSELHLTYSEEGVAGYGDFSIVGDRYSETGGPAYAVAIHLTYISKSHDDEMWIHHFVSDSVDTPVDPAGKFAEAVEKLVQAVNEPGSEIMRTSAVDEFLDLREREHFPGLGYIKKLSMIHHLEVLDAFGD